MADTELAEASGREPARIAAALTDWPTLQRDPHGNVVALSGLSLTPTAHRFTVDGRDLHAWCAWDTLFLPALLDRSVAVQSRCAVTGRAVRLTVAPEGISDHEPDSLAVCFPPPDSVACTSVRSSFCTHVHFLAGPDATAPWRVEHPGAPVLDLHQADALGLRVSDPCWTF